MRGKSKQEVFLTPLTIPEFTTVARCSEATAYRWVKAKKIESVRIGRRILIPRSVLTRLTKGSDDAAC